MAENKADGQCNGIDFYVDEYWRFIVPELGDKRFSSYEEVQAAIDAFVKSKEASKRERTSIQVMDRDGKSIVFTGIHAGHGRVITKPKMSGRHGMFHDQLWPDVPWLHDANKELTRLESLVAKYQRVMDRFAVNVDTNYSYEASQYSARMMKLTEGFAEKRAAAEKTTLEKELAKPER